MAKVGKECEEKRREVRKKKGMGSGKRVEANGSKGKENTEREKEVKGEKLWVNNRKERK